MSHKPPLLESMHQFLFEAPLYTTYLLGEDLNRVEEFFGRTTVKVDGHCLGCGREATFEVVGAQCSGGTQWDEIRERVSFDGFYIRCTRQKHIVRFWFNISKMTVRKVGQYPSLADIAHDEVKVYRNILPKELSSEFHKAIGLAAHGVGVGSFVYLRRVFERLVENRFNEFKMTEGWDSEKFRRLRMEDKIDLLKGHLPEFLVANKKIYSILSLGIHELGEADCLTYFDVVKHSIIMILGDDRKAREERERRAIFEKVIQSFQAPKTANEESSSGLETTIPAQQLNRPLR